MNIKHMNLLLAITVGIMISNGNDVLAMQKYSSHITSKTNLSPTSSLLPQKNNLDNSMVKRENNVPFSGTQINQMNYNDGDILEDLRHYGEDLSESENDENNADNNLKTNNIVMDFSNIMPQGNNNHNNNRKDDIFDYFNNNKPQDNDNKNNQDVELQREPEKNLDTTQDIFDKIQDLSIDGKAGNNESVNSLYNNTVMNIKNNQFPGLQSQATHMQGNNMLRNGSNNFTLLTNNNTLNANNLTGKDAINNFIANKDQFSNNNTVQQQLQSDDDVIKMTVGNVLLNMFNRHSLVRAWERDIENFKKQYPNIFGVLHEFFNTVSLIQDEVINTVKASHVAKSADIEYQMYKKNSQLSFVSYLIKQQKELSSADEALLKGILLNWYEARQAYDDIKQSLSCDFEIIGELVKQMKLERYPMQQSKLTNFIDKNIKITKEENINITKEENINITKEKQKLSSRYFVADMKQARGVNLQMDNILTDIGLSTQYKGYNISLNKAKFTKLVSEDPIEILAPSMTKPKDFFATIFNNYTANAWQDIQQLCSNLIAKFRESYVKYIHEIYKISIRQYTGQISSNSNILGNIFDPNQTVAVAFAKANQPNTNKNNTGLQPILEEGNPNNIMDNAFFAPQQNNMFNNPNNDGKTPPPGFDNNLFGNTTKQSDIQNIVTSPILQDNQNNMMQPNNNINNIQQSNIPPQAPQLKQTELDKEYSSLKQQLKQKIAEAEQIQNKNTQDYRNLSQEIIKLRARFDEIRPLVKGNKPSSNNIQQKALELNPYPTFSEINKPTFNSNIPQNPQQQSAPAYSPYHYPYNAPQPFNSNMQPNTQQQASYYPPYNPQYPQQYNAPQQPFNSNMQPNTQQQASYYPPYNPQYPQQYNAPQQPFNSNMQPNTQQQAQQLTPEQRSQMQNEHNSLAFRLQEIVDKARQLQQNSPEFGKLKSEADGINSRMIYLAGLLGNNK